jgi:hypothetical protein
MGLCAAALLELAPTSTRAGFVATRGGGSAVGFEGFVCPFVLLDVFEAFFEAISPRVEVSEISRDDFIGV